MKNKVIVSIGILIFIFTANCLVVPTITTGEQVIPGVPDDYASAALEAWGVPFKSGLIEQISDRAIANSAGDSRIWVTTADDNCRAPGINRELCNFGPQTIAICQVRYYRETNIIQTAIIYLRERYINDPDFSDTQKKATLIHELGHCIGLQHWTEDGVQAARQNIMYPFLTDRVKPSSEELDAVAYVYPSGGTESREPLQAHAPRYADGSRRQAVTNPSVIFTSAAGNLSGEDEFSVDALSPPAEERLSDTTIFSIQGEPDANEEGHQCKEKGTKPIPQEN